MNTDIVSLGADRNSAMRRADLADLTAFVAVADNLSFRAAASHIGVTPSALSRTDAATRGAPCGPASGTRCLGTASCRLRDPSPVPFRHNGIAFRDRGTEGPNPAPSSGESGTNRTPSLRGRRSIHQLDRYRRDIRRLGRQRRYGFDCDVRGMIMPGTESRNQGGREHATQPDPDQNLACRTA